MASDPKPQRSYLKGPLGLLSDLAVSLVMRTKKRVTRDEGDEVATSADESPDPLDEMEQAGPDGQPLIPRAPQENRYEGQAVIASIVRPDIAGKTRRQLAAEVSPNR